MYPFLQGKTVLLGVSASVAIYKSIELARRLRKMQCNIHVIMTKHATRLIAPQLFHAISSNPVYVEQFSDHYGMSHIDVASNADVFLVFPATADVIAKFASGIADDFLSTTFLSVKCPVILCPAMNVAMWNNHFVQENVLKLQQHDVTILGPVLGDLACGDKGCGKLVSIDEVEYEVMKKLAPHDFPGKNIVVTAGGTREWLDDVRFISNASSGKMGYAIAKAASLRGASVQLVRGQTTLPVPYGVRCIDAEDAHAMSTVLSKLFSWADVIISAAAVSDYRPQEKFQGKRKKNGKNWIMKLEETEDILKMLSSRRGKKSLPLLVGFSLENEHVTSRAREKLKRKNIDMIIANTPCALSASEAEVCILAKSSRKSSLMNSKEQCITMSKALIAWHILDRVLSLLAV